MDIAKWIEDHSFEVRDNDFKVIYSKDLERLLETHTIVPNEPTEAIIRAVTKTRYNNIISLRGQNSKEDFIEEYKSILVASQENQE